MNTTAWTPIQIMMDHHRKKDRKKKKLRMKRRERLEKQVRLTSELSCGMSFQDLEESLDVMVAAGRITEEQAVHLTRTVIEVSAGTRCGAATLEPVDLENTEGMARMDVVVRGPEEMGEPAVYHVTGVARRDVARILYGHPDSRRIRPEMQPESEEEGGEREPEEEAGPEEREEEGEVEESTEDAARRAEHQNHVHARRACLNYAEYIMFQRKTRESRARYVENMAKLGIEITAENESNNALIRREVVEEDDGAY